MTNATESLGSRFKGWLRQSRVDLFHYLFPSRALRRIHARDKERELELRCIPALVDPDSASIDVGANAGLYTAALADACARVIAIEPHPRLAHLLGGFPKDKVSVLRAVASANDGEDLELEVELVASRQLDALAHIASGEKSGTAKRYPVTSVSLDRFADQPISFVKIDVEGHELEVLKGADELIAKRQPVFLVEAEYRHRSLAPGDVFAFFAERGYAGFFLHQKKAKPIASFTEDMQDEDLLIGYAKRELCAYVNNFIFVPASRDLAAVMRECEALVAAA